MNLGGAGFLPAVVDERIVFPDLAGRTIEEVLSEMAGALEKAGIVRDGEDVARRLIERERIGSTGLGNGLAIPHCKLHELDDVVLAVGVSRAGIDFHAADGVPVTLVFLVVSPADAPGLHLQALARISRITRMPGVADSLRLERSAGSIAEALRRAEGSVPAPA